MIRSNLKIFLKKWLWKHSGAIWGLEIFEINIYITHILNLQQRQSMDITLSPSKSSCARYIVDSHVKNKKIDRSLLSTCDDTQTLLKYVDANKGIVDVGPAGTCMRFLMALYAAKAGTDIILTGSERMLQRPIQQLVDMLMSMGADIKKLKNGWRIIGKQLSGITIDCTDIQSSQFVSAILLIEPLINGTVELKNIDNCASKKYLQHTIDFINNPIIEPDWSALSFVYAYAITHPKEEIVVHNYRINSFSQELEDLATQYGIITKIDEANCVANISSLPWSNECISYDFTNIPDEIPAFVVASTYMKYNFKFTGIETLKGKECDRLAVLKENLDDNIKYDELSVQNNYHFPMKHKLIKTYNDHRIAMAFASCGVPKDLIENPDVVNKSWPKFWTEFNIK